MSNTTSAIKRHPVLIYYILTFVLSYGALLFLFIRDGLPSNRQELNQFILFAIPFMLLGPGISGFLMIGLVDGRAGFHDLWERMRRWQVGAGWYAIALLLPIALNLAIPAGLSLFSPEYLPGIFTTADKTSRLIMNLTSGVAVGILEEIGWMGFVAPKLMRRYSSLQTGLIIGVLWGLWHILPMAVMPSLALGAPVAPGVYIAFRSVSFLVGGLVACRVLMLWVYENTHSLFVMVALHISLTSSNMLFSPDTLAGMSNFVIDLVGIITWWVIAALVLAAGRRLSVATVPHHA